MSIAARQHPIYASVILFLLTVLVYGTVRELTAHAAHAGQAPAPTTAAAVRTQAESQGQVTLHVADPDADVGPGEAEPMLAQHPTP